jgi:hypothetical protein
MIVTRNQAAKKLGMSSKTLNRFVFHNGIKPVSTLKQNGFVYPTYVFEEIEKAVKEKYTPQYITRVRSEKRVPDSITSSEFLRRSLDFYKILNKLY